MSIQEEAIRAIEAQQAKVKKPSLQWQVGEQLKDICRWEPRSAELIAQDLEQSSMSIIEAEKKIAAFARKNNGSVTGWEADRILREFYGLPKPSGEPEPVPVPVPTQLPEDPPRRKLVDLTDFL